MDKKELIDILSSFAPLILSFSFVFVTLFVKKHRSKSDIILAAFFFLIFCIQLEFFVAYLHINPFSFWFLSVFVFAIQATAPLQYVYVKSLSSLKPLNKKTLLHFIAPLASLTFMLLINIFYYDFAKEDAYWTLMVGMTIGMGALLNLIYIPKSIILYVKHKKNTGNLFSYNKGVDLKWMRLAIAGYVFYFTSLVLVEILDFTYDEYFLPLVYFGYLFYLIINGLKQKPIADVFNSKIDLKPLEINTDLVKQANANTNVSTESKDKNQDKDRYKTSSLKDEERIQEIISSLTNYIEESKEYRNPRLNMMDISRKIGINYKYISQAINHHYNKNFQSLIAEYRVEDAKKLILDVEYENLTLEAMGEICGFQSKSTFYTTFKKITGKTPMQYKEEAIA